MKTKLLILSIAVLCFSAAPAMADFIAPTESLVTFGTSTDPGNPSLQDVLDNITVSPNPGVSSVTTTTDTILDSWDSYWMIGGQGQSAASMVIEISGYDATNTLGVYDATNPANMVPIFTGGATAGNKATLSIQVDGSVWVVQTYPTVSGGDSGIDFAGNLFGFYLSTPSTPGGGIAYTYYSDTALNTADNYDHLRAYQGKGIDDIQIGSSAAGLWQTDTYALAWEDLYGGGDEDYQDFVAMIESVTPVPVPAAVLLGILGLGVAGLKLRKYA